MKTHVIFLISAFMLASCSQTAYRWRNDNGNEMTATWMADINEVVIYDGSGNIRLRIQYDFGDNIPFPKDNDNEQASAGALYYSLSIDGPWTRITDDMNNAFVLSHSHHLTDGEPTSNLLPPVANRSFISGKVYTSTFTDIFSELPGGFSEFEWSIKSTPKAKANTYYFTAGQVLNDLEPDKADIETSAIDDQGNDLYIPEITDYVQLIYSPKTIPLRNWSVAILVVLISGFLIYSFRKKLA